MNKKDVIIFVKGEQCFEGQEPDEVEIITEGTMTIQEDGVILLEYQETELSGMEGVTTRFTIRGNTVELSRSGAVTSTMRFEQGAKHSSLYETPWGTLTVDIRTSRLICRIGDRGGIMEICYAIAVDQRAAGSNRFKIRVRESMR